MSERNRFFVSDLHKFARRSQSERYEPQIREAFKTAGQFVFGGDIFDFKWATQANQEIAVYEAIEWLEELHSLNPACKIDYVLGNHDHFRPFVEAFEEFAARTGVADLHTYHFRQNDILFLHGEPADRKMDLEALIEYRARYKHMQKKPYHHSIYSVAIALNLHRLTTVTVHGGQRDVLRLTHFMDNVEQAFANGIRRVYFGHTHRRRDGVECNGVKFFNCGAPVGNLNFQLLRF